MQLWSTRIYPRLCVVLLALCVVLTALQPAFAQHSPTPPLSTLQTDMHSQHTFSTQASVSCDVDCAGAVHHCCLYALCSSQPLIRTNPSAAQHSLLPYFFSSRHVTPLT